VRTRSADAHRFVGPVRWYWFEDSRGRLSQCDAAHKQLVKYVPGYDKTRLEFGCFERGVADAVQRAKALDPSGGRFELNPSTSVWRLVERMME